MKKKKMYESGRSGNGKSYYTRNFYASEMFHHVSNNLSDEEIGVAIGYYEMLLEEPEIIIEQNPFNL